MLRHVRNKRGEVPVEIFYIQWAALAVILAGIYMLSH